MTGSRRAAGARGADAVDWPALMRAGLGALRLPPGDFWAMTPREFRHALEGAGLLRGPAALGRAELERMMAAHPDRPADQ
jgi:uncharacterized phage protein (TIGR02216 family)